MKLYSRVNPLHWLLAFFSNSRKNTYLHEGTLHVADSGYRATQRLLYWFRNPAHDFTHYIIGFQDDPNYRMVRGYRLSETTGLRAAIFAWHWLRLPYVAYDSERVRLEFGWSDGGAFNLKVRRAPNYQR